MKYRRSDSEPPQATANWGWRYHHTGIPTNKIQPGEEYLPEYGIYHCGFESSPFGIEWMRYEPDSPVDDLIKTLPHVAFEVDDLDEELAKHDFRIITLPDSPSCDVRVAMIEHNGAPVELIEFKKKG